MNDEQERRKKSGGSAMSHIILIVGGARSGKSEYARRLAETMPGPKTFIATAIPLDAEMQERIRKHQQARDQSGWDVVEEPIDLVRAIKKSRESAVVLVDCLALWINNLMHDFDERSENLTEETLAVCCNEVIETCRGLQSTVVFVADEVGMGIVPDNFSARRFRDLAGRCNQVIAAAADEVTFVVCGLPIRLKSDQ